MDGAGGRYPWRWRLEDLLRGLRSERSCSAHELEECWLIQDLPSWNKALRAVRLVLTAYEPGKLCLRSYDDRDELWESDRGLSNANDGAFLMAWLPRQHFCIREVRAYDRAHIDGLSYISSVVVGAAPNLETVVLHPSRRLQPVDRCLQAFGPPKCLRELDLTNVIITGVMASTVANVLKGNRRTLLTVKLIGNDLSRDSASTLLLGLVACERLEDLTLQDSTLPSACDAMAEAFRSTRVLRKLSLVGLSEAGMSCLKSLFGALEGVLTFQHLALEKTSVNDTVGKALANFMIGHHSLKTLSLQNCSFESTGATFIVEALSANCSLEHLNLHNSSLQAATVSSLCSALSGNTTLKSLVLPDIRSTSPILLEKNSTPELLRQECRGRVQFRLLVHWPSSMSATLAQALGCAAKVRILHRGFAGNISCSVYSPLALNQSLRSLYVVCDGGPTGHDGTTQAALTNALCTALKACGGLQSFHLDVHRAYTDSEETAALLDEIFDALLCNPHIRKLSLVTSQLTLKTAEKLSALVGQCKRSLVELHIGCTGTMSDAVLAMLQKMITENVHLSNVSVRSSAWKDAMWLCAAMDDAKEENQGLLNKAAQFVMSLDGEPAVSAKLPGASAFDQLDGTASLKEHLMSLSKKPKVQVSADMKRARCHLQDNYMIYAGVVRLAVHCKAGDGSTQFDALSVDCWRSIAQYLKLSDVV